MKNQYSNLMNKSSKTTRLKIEEYSNEKWLYLNNVNGISGESITGNRSKYIIEEYRLDPRQFGIYSFYNNNINDHFYLTAGFNADNYTKSIYSYTHRFQVIVL